MTHGISRSKTWLVAEAALEESSDVSEDETDALKHQRAADQGDAAAQYNLGNVYLEGRGMPQDDAKALTNQGDGGSRRIFDALGSPAPLTLKSSAPLADMNDWLALDPTTKGRTDLRPPQRSWDLAGAAPSGVLRLGDR